MLVDTMLQRIGNEYRNRLGAMLQGFWNDSEIFMGFLHVL